MPIYKIAINYEEAVEAASAEEAMDYALNNRSEITYDSEPEVMNCGEIKSLADLPPGWDGDSFAWGETPAVDGSRLRDLCRITSSTPQKPRYTMTTRESEGCGGSGVQLFATGEW